jgi:DNA helicase-2/ATP-dependent DNA helicase PcrA
MFSSAIAPPATEASWLEQLNPEQRRAATHPPGPLLILAGAGTGKTTTLCARVAWLVAEGASPERMMLLTFTRRAAREMLQRTRTYVQLPGGSRGVLGGTFHSVAHLFVRRHASALGLASGFGVLDAGDAADLIDLIREEHGHAQSKRRFPRKTTLLDIYSRTINAQQPVRQVVTGQFPWCEEHVEAMAVLFKAYGARKRALGVLDLDDLLLYWRALVSDEVVGPTIQDAFDHVLIDEYQDVNGLQVEIVRALRLRRRSVTAVGDDFQAIYGWRAASAEHILRFPEHFADAAVVTLERNYRASQPLLDIANALAAQASRAFRKRLWTEVGDASPPELVYCRDESAQASEVCDRVLDARERGMQLREQSVLSRTSHDTGLLELELTRRGVPFVKYGGLRYLEAAHVKDLIALLRLADSPADEISWFRVLQLLDGVGPATARRVLDRLVRATSADWAKAWPAARDQLPPAAHAPADRLIEALGETRRGQSSGARAERLRDAIAPLIETRYQDAAIRLADLDQLVAAAREHRGELCNFVGELVLDPPQSSSDLAGPPHLDEDHLVLSTIHSAKGLEWNAVHVIALYDGNLPADMAAGTKETIDEERRLLYVAMTRPRRALHLYVPVRYYHRPNATSDSHGYGNPSRFLTEELQRLCRISRPAEQSGQLPAGEAPGRRITVSADSLFD